MLVPSYYLVANVHDLLQEVIRDRFAWLFIFILVIEDGFSRGLF